MKAMRVGSIRESLRPRQLYSYTVGRSSWFQRFRESICLAFVKAVATEYAVKAKKDANGDRHSVVDDIEYIAEEENADTYIYENHEDSKHGSHALGLIVVIHNLQVLISFRFLTFLTIQKVFGCRKRQYFGR